MKSIRECVYRTELDMETLVWTRVEHSRSSTLKSRLKCPRCGSRRVILLFDIPKVPNVARSA